MNKLSILILGALMVSSASALSIESTNFFPQQPEHGDFVYTEMEVEDAESVWYEVVKDSEKISTGSLTDRNNDNYYVSPTGFKVEGEETYTIKFYASKGADVTEEETRITTNCKIGLLDSCFL